MIAQIKRHYSYKMLHPQFNSQNHEQTNKRNYPKTRVWISEPSTIIAKLTRGNFLLQPPSPFHVKIQSFHSEIHLLCNELQEAWLIPSTIAVGSLFNRTQNLSIIILQHLVAIIRCCLFAARSFPSQNLPKPRWQPTTSEQEKNDDGEKIGHVFTIVSKQPPRGVCCKINAINKKQKFVRRKSEIW